MRENHKKITNNSCRSSKSLIAIQKENKENNQAIIETIIVDYMTAYRTFARKEKLESSFDGVSAEKKHWVDLVEEIVLRGFTMSIDDCKKVRTTLQLLQFLQILFVTKLYHFRYGIK